QLHSLNRQASEQERAMMELMKELAAEKRARDDERQARERREAKPRAMSEGCVSEDLGVDDEERRTRKWRRSGDTIRSDVSFDACEESAEDENTSSQSRSPALTAGAEAAPPPGAQTGAPDLGPQT